MSDYYARKSSTFVDGSEIFKSAEDEASESEIASILEKTWKCECRGFGKLAPLDWFFVRNGRLVGIGELKTRSHKSDKYTTVFLNSRKWLALLFGSIGLGVPAVFVVRFEDCVMWINASEIDSTRLRIGGCKQIVKSRNDVEPVIEVVIKEMTRL